MSHSDLQLEQVYVHSRDLACRYVLAKPGETISYSVKPQRNSIFLGVYRQGAGRRHSGSSGSIAKPSRAAGTPGSTSSMSLVERLQQAQLELVTKTVKLLGGKVHKGSLDVKIEGTYALVFDNTFSKQKSKTISYVLQVHPSTSERPSNTSEPLLDDDEPTPEVREEHLTGVLLKRRRKKLQGWARRWFVLDFESSTLNYYLNSSSTVLRGAISLKVAVFSANKEGLEINIDNGEVWNLRAQSEGAFSMWCQALAASRDSGAREVRTAQNARHSLAGTRAQDGIIQREAMSTGKSHLRFLTQLETVLTEIEDVRGSLRDAIINGSSFVSEAQIDRGTQASPSRPKGQEGMRYESTNLSVPRKNFWGKKRSSELPALAPSTEELFASVKASTTARNHLVKIEAQLDTALLNFDRILRDQRSLLQPRPLDHIAKMEQIDLGRMSLDSTRSDEDVWADAVSVFEDGGFLVAHHDPGSAMEDVDDASSEDESLVDTLSFDRNLQAPTSSIAEEFASDLYPITELDAIHVKRRCEIPMIMDQPPSTLKLMTSKVGSDVSTMSAPAASNEPLGLLQRVAEDLEYSELLDVAVQASAQDGSRILTIAAFAVSSFSSMRHKERAKRKPFNPMLGETFEVVREDKGYRFIAEKVQHRPIVGIASFAESASWTFHQYQATTQKFYGKSMLLTTEGLTTVHLSTGDVYVWEKPELYLKGITWGEKSLEPSGEMMIRNIVNGDVAIVKFLPTKGWGSGRSEELTVEAYNASNSKYGKTITGSWAQSLLLDNTVIWKAGDLAEQPANRCGFTTFAAQLNEVTAIEKEKIPLSDSRLRPDMRAREEGRLEDAERLKTVVEESQRRRRAELETAGDVWQPKFFEPSSDGKRWNVKRGEHNYWALRQKGFKDAGIIDLFS